MGLFALITFLVILVGLVLLSRVFRNFQPSNRRIQADLKQMKEEVKQLADELVPMNREELELFSLDQVNRLVKKGIARRARGVFTTIFHEPVVAYSYKKYISPGLNALLYARTANHEYAYRIRNKGIQVVIDNQLVGTLKDNGVLYSAQGKKILGRIKRNEEGLLPVIVNDREVASVVKALPQTTTGKSLSTRAFEFVKEDMNPQEEQVFLSLALLELIQRST